MMFHAMLSTLVRQLYLPQECLHEEGLDLQAGPFSLHIRERDQLVTLFIPLGDLQTPSLAAMADWPVLQLSRDSEQSTLLWCREWLDKLDVDLLTDMVSRMLHQADVLTQGRDPTTPEGSGSAFEQAISQPNYGLPTTIRA
ncbi:hypothetical protein EHZ86_04710 [Aeromonas australiensis]|uniref:hypothetical protein n=1 Tax=Aeromonas australiensis TaxID=1114880 RepID=UPI001F2D6BC9|nr:hypothetical protein [Aeromonas australiensis]MCF3096628.1 hypothetical protein [Aeromonas australiensis]